MEKRNKKIAHRYQFKQCFRKLCNVSFLLYHCDNKFGLQKQTWCASFVHQNNEIEDHATMYFDNNMERYIELIEQKI